MRGATSCCRFTKIGKRHFNPRTPCGVRLAMTAQIGLPKLFQSTHPLRGATASEAAFNADTEISIHAPLAGCDFKLIVFSFRRFYFNPRTPCGVRQLAAKDAKIAEQFQSTHPLRGATSTKSSSLKAYKFQSTHPLRGATCVICPKCGKQVISIHAPLAGCDQKTAAKANKKQNFNPRTPCGVRRHDIYTFFAA